MLTPFETGAETLPCVVRLSGAYAAGETTAREYNAALRVAVLEDAVKRPFCEATWSKVQVGDTVLLPWLATNKIVKAEIRKCTFEPGLVIVLFNCGGLWGQTFGPEETVYVQSRL